jgi:hypothetical protein
MAAGEDDMVTDEGNGEEEQTVPVPESQLNSLHDAARSVECLPRLAPRALSMKE